MKANRIIVPVTTLALLLAASPAFAADEMMASPKGMIAIGAGIAIGVAALGGGLGQGMAARAALEGVARNPNAQGKILPLMVLGLALIESLVILSWLVANKLAGFAA
jgi:F-type H+-transporting ATPase subunit c